VAVDSPGGIRELLEDVPASRLVPPDADLLADAIVHMLRSAATEERTKPDSLQRFDLRSIVRSYESLLAGEAQA